MEENPFTTIVNVMNSAAKSASSPGWRLGTIKNISPLQIETRGLKIGPAGLFVCPLVLTDAAVGDSVVILPNEDEQELYIICKVVKA